MISKGPFQPKAFYDYNKSVVETNFFSNLSSELTPRKDRVC